jgi:hypothetical protein
MNLLELKMTDDFQMFNKVQLYYATIPNENTRITPAQFYAALFMAFNNSDIPPSHKDYIADKLNCKGFENKQHLIELLISQSNSLTTKAIDTTPTYIIDGGLRTISVLINYANLNDVGVINNIYRLLAPCFKQYQASLN